MYCRPVSEFFNIYQYNFLYRWFCKIIKCYLNVLVFYCYCSQTQKMEDDVWRFTHIRQIGIILYSLEQNWLLLLVSSLHHEFCLTILIRLKDLPLNVQFRLKRDLVDETTLKGNCKKWYWHRRSFQGGSILQQFSIFLIMYFQT